jgi:SAM-dependent methyltransferase
MAALADKYDLYQRAVQSPDHEAWIFNRIFKKEYGRDAKILREDFCGTAAVCCEWVNRRPDRRAYGVDLDPEPLEWGRANNLSRLPEVARDRVKLVVNDACKVHGPKADVVAAQNFSFQFFMTRAELLRYFKAAYRNLGKDGLLFMDVLGGSEVLEEDHEEEKKFRGFNYIWEQKSFNPISHVCDFGIHFEFPDGSKLENAFAYHWRLWSIPEVRELLAEAGFSRSDVYWEGDDDVFRRREVAPSDPCWICYVIGVK